MERLSTLTERYERAAQVKAFVEYARAKLLACDGLSPLALLEDRLGRQAPELELFKKAAVAALTGTTTAELIQVRLGDAWLEEVRKATILGQLTSAFHTGFQVHTPAVMTGAATTWVGQAQPIPAVRLDVAGIILDPLKQAALLGFSVELLRATDARALELFDRCLRAAVARGDDTALLSDAAAVPSVSPAGLLAGLSPAGGSPAAIVPDVESLWGACRGGNPMSPVFVCSPRGAAFLSMITDGGARPFDRVSAPAGTRGEMLGAPQLAAPAALDRLILIDSAALVLADEGIIVDSSRQTSLRLDDSPNGGPLTSAFQQNLAFLRITRFLNFQLAFVDGAAFVNLPLGSPA